MYRKLPAGGLPVADFDEVQWRYCKMSETEVWFTPLMIGSGTFGVCS